jgi:hypothetical protein
MQIMFSVFYVLLCFATYHGFTETPTRGIGPSESWDESSAMKRVLPWPR